MMAYASCGFSLTAVAKMVWLSVIVSLTLSGVASAQEATDTIKQVNAAQSQAQAEAESKVATLKPNATTEAINSNGAAKPNFQTADSLFNQSKSAPSNSMVQGGSVLQVLLSLAFIIVLIYAGAWYFRRMQLGGGSAQAMRVVSALSVGTRERVVLVQVGEQQLLLGVAPGRVNLLQTIDQGSGQFVEANSTTGSQTAMTKSFAKILDERSESLDSESQAR